jgi:hypothetical protein
MACSSVARVPAAPADYCSFQKPQMGENLLYYRFIDNETDDAHLGAALRARFVMSWNWRDRQDQKSHKREFCTGKRKIFKGYKQESGA